MRAREWGTKAGIQGLKLPRKWKYVNLPNLNTLRCVCVSHWSCPTLCDPMDCSPPGSFVHGILQTRTLEWVAVSFSNVNFNCGSVVAKSYLTLMTPQTVACQDLLSMGFSRQEYWSGLPFPSSLKCLESSNEQSAQMDRIQKSLNSPSAGPDFLACTWAHVNWMVQLWA